MTEKTFQTAFPLQWPQGKSRYSWPKASPFKKTDGQCILLLKKEVSMLCGTNLVISSNIQLRKDGLPYADQRINDAGVAVYFVYRSKQMCFACDQWKSPYHNMLAIQKTIEALRGISRWGTGDMMESAFNGFTALPPPASSSDTVPWWIVLGLAEKPRFSGEVTAAARAVMQRWHPDKEGGDAEVFKRIVIARDKGLKELS